MDNQPEVQKKMLGVTSNIVILSGRLGGNALWRSSTQGREYLCFMLGTVCYSYLTTNERSGTTSREDVMDWHECRIYNLPYADAMQTYLTRGSFVTVKGGLRAVRWTDRQGNKRSSVYVEVGEVAVIEHRVAAVAVIEQPAPKQVAAVPAITTPIRSRRPSRLVAQAA